MKYAVITGNNILQFLKDEKGKQISLDPKKTGVYWGRVFNYKDAPMKQLVEILDENKAKNLLTRLNSCIEIFDGEINDFNSKIDELFIPQYEIWSDGALNADIIVKSNNGSIDLSEIQEDWTSEERKAWYYNKGLNGIKRNNKPDYK